MSRIKRRARRIFVSSTGAFPAYDPAQLLRRRSLVHLVRSIPGLALGAAVVLVSAETSAGPSDAAKGGKGLGLAKKGDCVKAVPLLEDAELGRHRPATAVALADCYVRVGELISASDLYHAVVDDKPTRSWTRDDHNAWKAAQRKAEAVDARIPVIVFEIPEDYEDLEIELGDRKIEDPKEPQKVPADTSITLVARAKGRKEFSEKLVLNERERRTVLIKFDGPGGPSGPTKSGGGGGGGGSTPAPPTKPGQTQTWIGARYRGVIIPKGLFHIFADGARSVFGPGLGVTLTVPVSDIELVVSLGYINYNMRETPFKPKGAPDTDWEFVTSTLHALTATLDLRWSIPLDARGIWTLKVGGGVGVGWTFAGDIYRAQVFPAKLKPADPYTYLRCKGPNDPRGTFAYCNTLERDAAHYGNYEEPNWFEHGVRPLIFPWVVLPEVGISWKATKKVAVELGLGASLSGIVTDLGFRVAL